MVSKFNVDSNCHAAGLIRTMNCLLEHEGRVAVAYQLGKSIIRYKCIGYNINEMLQPVSVFIC